MRGANFIAAPSIESYQHYSSIAQRVSKYKPLQNILITLLTCDDRFYLALDFPLSSLVQNVHAYPSFLDCVEATAQKRKKIGPVKKFLDWVTLDYNAIFKGIVTISSYFQIGPHDLLYRPLEIEGTRRSTIGGYIRERLSFWTAADTSGQRAVETLYILTKVWCDTRAEVISQDAVSALFSLPGEAGPSMIVSLLDPGTLQ